MAQAKQTGRDKSLASLHKATDTLSTMLAQEVKDLAGVSKTLNDQGVDAEGRECGVVLLPPVEDV